jgi:hypothetical protein
MWYEGCIDNHSAWGSPPPTGLDEADNLGILNPLLIALEGTIDNRTKGSIGNIRAGCTIMLEECLFTRAVEAVPEAIIKAGGQGGCKKDGLDVHLLQPAKLGKFRTKGITGIQKHMAFINHNAIQPTETLLAIQERTKVCTYSRFRSDQHDRGFIGRAMALPLDTGNAEARTTLLELRTKGDQRHHHHR